jgi:hypothetical protein
MYGMYVCGMDVWIVIFKMLQSNQLSPKSRLLLSPKNRKNSTFSRTCTKKNPTFLFVINQNVRYIVITHTFRESREEKSEWGKKDQSVRIQTWPSVPSNITKKTKQTQFPYKLSVWNHIQHIICEATTVQFTTYITAEAGQSKENKLH